MDDLKSGKQSGAADVERRWDMSLLDGLDENFRIFRGDENRIDKEAFDSLVEENELTFITGYMKITG